MGDECFVCGNPFDKTKHRRLIDACGHTMCRPCLIQSDECPLCASGSEVSHPLKRPREADYPRAVKRRCEQYEAEGQNRQNETKTLQDKATNILLGVLSVQRAMLERIRKCVTGGKIGSILTWQEILKDIYGCITGTKEGSIILVIKFATVSDLDHLIEMYRSNQLEQAFLDQFAPDELQEQFTSGQLKLKTTIDESELREYRNFLITQGIAVRFEIRAGSVTPSDTTVNGMSDDTSEDTELTELELEVETAKSAFHKLISERAESGDLADRRNHMEIEGRMYEVNPLRLKDLVIVFKCKTVADLDSLLQTSESGLLQEILIRKCASEELQDKFQRGILTISTRVKENEVTDYRNYLTERETRLATRGEVNWERRTFFPMQQTESQTYQTPSTSNSQDTVGADESSLEVKLETNEGREGQRPKQASSVDKSSQCYQPTDTGSSCCVICGTQCVPCPLCAKTEADKPVDPPTSAAADLDHRKVGDTVTDTRILGDASVSTQEQQKLGADLQQQGQSFIQKLVYMSETLFLTSDLASVPFAVMKVVLQSVTESVASEREKFLAVSTWIEGNQGEGEYELLDIIKYEEMTREDLEVVSAHGILKSEGCEGIGKKVTALCTKLHSCDPAMKS